MDKKKVAKRVLIIFISIMVFLTFASRTIIYFTTPKVFTERVKSGQIDNSRTFETVNLEYSDSKEIKFEREYSEGINVKAINVSVGDNVKAGTVIASFDTTQMQTNLSNLQDSVSTARISLNDFQKNYNRTVEDKTIANNRLNQEIASLNAQINSFVIVTTTNEETGQQTNNSSELEMLKRSREEKVLIYNRDVEDLNEIKNTGILNGTTLEKSQKAYDDAQKAYDDAKFIADNYTELKMPEDGIVYEISLQVGSPYKGDLAAFKYRQSNIPSRILVEIPNEDVKDIEADIQKSKSANIKLYKSNNAEGSIKEIINKDGKKYLVVEAKNPDILQDIKPTDISIIIVKKSGQYEAIIPVKALFGDKVYIINEKRGFLGDELVVKEVKVKVGDANSTQVGIQSGLSSFDTIITSTDRTLKDGQKVLKSTETTNSSEE